MSGTVCDLGSMAAAGGGCWVCWALAGGSNRGPAISLVPCSQLPVAFAVGFAWVQFTARHPPVITTGPTRASGLLYSPRIAGVATIGSWIQEEGRTSRPAPCLVARGPEMTGNGKRQHPHHPTGGHPSHPPFWTAVWALGCSLARSGNLSQAGPLLSGSVCVGDTPSSHAPPAHQLSPLWHIASYITLHVRPHRRCRSTLLTRAR